MLRLGTRWRRSKKPPARPCRPGLEQLENRLAPAAYQVNTFQDTPAVNLHTGQDVSGHVSLRAALMAANASAPGDIIFLGAGVYAAEAGPLAVHGDLQIIGRGVGQTVIEVRHLDRLFEVEGGSLELTGLTLSGGSASTLIKGNVHLTNGQITDMDIAAVLSALLAPKAGEPTPQLPAQTLPTKKVSPQTLRAPAAPEHLVGQPGGGPSTDRDQLQETAQDLHQAYWRVDAETAPEQPAQEMPDEMKQGSAAGETIVVATSAVQPENKTTKEAAIPAWREWESETVPVNDFGTSRAQEFGSPGPAIALFLVASFSSLPRLAKDSRLFRERRRRPPPCGPPLAAIPIRRKQGRQRCLPFLL